MLVNVQHKFYMSPFIGLLRSIKNKDQKPVPPRQDFVVLEALQASALRLGQSWQGLQRGENSPRKTEGELWVSVVPTHRSPLRPVQLGKKREEKRLFLFFGSPRLSQHNIKWKGRDVIRAIIQIHC